MIVRFRAATRAVVLALFLGAWFLLYWMGRLFCWNSRSRRWWRRHYMQDGARITLHLLGARVAVRGRAPDRACIVVCNHLGYVDVIVLASVARVVFVSRADVESWPGVGPLTKSAGTIFLDRQRSRSIPRALDRMRRAVSDGSGVVFFPEGTSSDGRDLLPFRSSLFQVAIEMGVPVCCAALAYRTPAGERSPEEAVAWWQDDLDFFPHCWRLLSLSSFEARVSFTEGRIEVSESTDRRSLCTEAEGRVRRALQDLKADVPNEGVAR